MRLSTVLVALGLTCAPAAALADTGLYLGVGPRFSSAGADTTGVLRVVMGLEPMLHLALDGYGYLTGPGTTDGTPLAGGGATLLFRPPIPGPFTAELGLGVGLANFTPDRHGVDDLRAYWNGEAAVGFGLGPLESRLVYQRVLGAPDGVRVGGSLTSQLMFMVGVEL